MFASLFGRRFWILAYLALALGQWLPGDYTALHPLIPFFLGGILFFTGLKIRLREVGAELRSGRQLLRLGWMSLMKLLVLPVAAWLLVRLVAPDWAAGVFLLGMMPAALACAAFADLYGGSLGMGLMMILVTSLLCPLSIPLLLQALSGHGGIDSGLIVHQALYIVALLGIPFVLAQGVRAAATGFVVRHHARWGYGAIGCMFPLVFVSMASNRRAWANYSTADLLPPLAAASLALLLFLLAGLALRRLLPRAEAIAVACSWIYMNNGLSVAFAGQFYNDDPHMLLPSLLAQIPIVAAVSFYGWWVERTSEPTSTAPAASDQQSEAGSRRPQGPKPLN